MLYSLSMYTFSFVNISKKAGKNKEFTERQKIGIKTEI